MSKTKTTSLDAMMDDASKALVQTRYFDAESLANKALHAAMGAHDYERMARICMPLLEARRQKRLEAIDTGTLVRVDDVEAVPTDPEPGCYLFEPMLVAADVRNFRQLADEQQVPVFALAREPKTQLGAWPVAMIGPVTLRAHVDPPAKGTPTIAWMQSAHEALGDAALEALNDDDAPDARVQDIVEILGALPDHERLHQALEAACRDAARAQSA